MSLHASYCPGYSHVCYWLNKILTNHEPAGLLAEVAPVAVDQGPLQLLGINLAAPGYIIVIIDLIYVASDNEQHCFDLGNLQ